MSHQLIFCYLFIKNCLIVTLCYLDFHTSSTITRFLRLHLIICCGFSTRTFCIYMNYFEEHFRNNFDTIIKHHVEIVV